MKLEHTDIIPRPLEQVYPLCRDNLEKIVPYLPAIKKIDVLSREDKDNKSYITNHWHATADVPKMAKKFISDELLSWKDIAVWHNDDHYVDYTLESFLANDLYDAQGKNSFRALNENETELIVSCDITLHAHKIPGVPRLLANTIRPVIEEILKKTIGPNMTSLGKGLQEYFARNS